MDFVDMLSKRFDGESDLKKPTHLLVCFTQPATGMRLARLAYQIALSRSDKSSITLLLFTDKREGELLNEAVEGEKTIDVGDYIPSGEKSKITLRSFVVDATDHLAVIERVREEQQCNLLLVGIANEELELKTVDRYSRLRCDPTNPMAAIFGQFREGEAKRLQQLSALVSQNSVPTGIFLDNVHDEVNHIFVPILSMADVHIFTYVYLMAQKSDVKITVWDAIGIIASESKMQQHYQFIVKKSDGSVHLWDDDRKIEEDFIREQDLIIIGVDGWSKLVNTPLRWKELLPSTLIIKDITT